ncbi:hypothetical protein AGLY_013428 [Aphis glycines]|uniref:Uncharacterized protein n=1 Tax=Aphis glycines TaxID=307491 RepID=A0A6G0T6M6_APHGL|nr:hypothetical protein AGLY_013428 [Aphis glycines]
MYHKKKKNVRKWVLRQNILLSNRYIIFILKHILITFNNTVKNNNNMYNSKCKNRIQKNITQETFIKCCAIPYGLAFLPVNEIEKIINIHITVIILLYFKDIMPPDKVYNLGINKKMSMEIVFLSKRKFHKDSWRRWIPRVRKNKKYFVIDSKNGRTFHISKIYMSTIYYL